MSNLLLVRFGGQDAGECLIKDFFQLVAASHCVALGLFAGFLQPHDLFHVHRQVRYGVTAPLLNVPDFW